MLSAGATVLDLGCGAGLPISQALIERGFNVYGVDASPTMVAAFRANFPNAPVECAAVEDSDFFGQTFGGAVAWGLLFLLDAEVQCRLIGKVAGVLRGGGRLLFTAPRQSGSWRDAMTGRISIWTGYQNSSLFIFASRQKLHQPCLNQTFWPGQISFRMFHP
jgi:cyclopropane fatty-acyl-phospholipid synthase-like methyltransferase